MKIGFTGTQTGMTEAQKNIIKKILQTFNVAEIHSGDCIGADADFYDIAFFLNLRCIGHIPNNDSKRAFKQYNEICEPKPYLVRNWDIVNGSDLLLATPKENEEQLRSGTWTTIRNAKKIGLPLIIVFPEGNWSAFNFKNLWKIN